MHARSNINMYVGEMGSEDIVLHEVIDLQK
jgi:hypothetical protein